MTFVITVKADVAGPQADAEKLVRTLEAGEDAGRRSGAGIAQGARAGASALERSRAAAEATGSSLAQLMGGLGRTGLAFDSLTSAIAREQAMLDRINGPSRKYEQHLQTLDSLLAKDRISTEQYAEQVKKLNRELERGSTIKAGPAAQPRAAGQAPSGGGPDAMATLGGLAHAAGLAYGAHEVFELTNAYGELSNRLKSVSSDSAQFNSLMSETYKVAQATRMEWNEVGFTYQRIAKATEHLGTTQDDVMRLTKEISQGLALSGASAQEARMSMAELTHAFELGTLTGREFKVLLKDATPIIGELAKALGVSRSEFIEMGKHGKITADMLMEGFDKAAPSIQAQFEKLTPTLEQSITTLKNSIEQLLGSFASATGIFKYVHDQVSDITRAFELAASAARALGDAAGSLEKKAGGSGAATTFLGKAWDYATHPIHAATDALELAGDGINALSDTLNEHNLAVSRVAQGYINQMSAAERLQEQQLKLAETAHVLDAARAAGAKVPAFDLASAQRQLELSANLKAMGISMPVAFGEATSAAKELGDEIEKFEEHRKKLEMKEVLERNVNAATGFNKVLEETAKHWRTIDDKINDVNNALEKYAKDRADLARVTGKDPLIEMYGKGRQDAFSIGQDEQQLLYAKQDLEREKRLSNYQFGKDANDNIKAFEEQKRAIEGWQAAVRDGVYTAEQAAFAFKKLGIELDRASKLLIEIRKPGIEYTKDVAALNLLLETGRIKLYEYENAMRKVTDAYAGSELRQLLEGVRAPKAPKLVSTGDEGDVTRARFEALQKYQDAVDKATADTEIEYKRPPGPDLEKDLAAYEAASASMKAMLDSIKAPAREYNLGLADARDLLREGSITSAQYELQIRKLEEAYFGATHAGKSFEDGLARGLHGIRLEIEDVGSAIETTLRDAFKGAEDALVEFVTKGEFNFGKLVDTMLSDLTRLILRQLEAAALSAALGGGGAAAGGGGIAAIGLDAIFGSSPKLASGGSMTVAGSPGIDTNLLTAWVSNGETVTVTPQGQAQQAAPQRPVTVVNVYDRSEMRSFMEVEGEGFVLNVMRRNETARRGRMTGR